MAETRGHYLETAPSQLREDEPTVSRWIGGIGWCVVLVGAVVAMANIFAETPRLIPESWGWILVQIGLMGILFHAAVENDRLLRQALAGAGIVAMIAGLVLAGVKYKIWAVGLLPFLPGLLVLVLYARRETEVGWRRISLCIIGITGALMALAGLLGMTVWPVWITGPGVVLAVIGLLTLAAFMGLEGSTSSAARWTALALGIAGALAFLYALGRSIVPVLIHDWRAPVPAYAMPLIVGGTVLAVLAAAGRSFLPGALGVTDPQQASQIKKLAGLAIALGGLLLGIGVLRFGATSLLRDSSWGTKNPEPFLVPTGIVLMLAGFLYGLVSVAFWSDNRLVVMVRREFLAYFYSPVAYIVMLGFTFLGGLSYYLFLIQMIRRAQTGRPLEEPIVQDYIISFLPVVAVMVAVPVLTMRLFSEEKRTGSIEVALTAPIQEWMLVVSKFLASLAFFMLLWLPWVLFLLALRLESGQPFDYRPILAFGLALLSSACGFVAMGVFFSSLTSNQIIAAVLTFMGMMLLIALYFLEYLLTKDTGIEGVLRNVFRSMSFIHMWFDTIRGKFALKHVVYHVSAAVFWLFLTVKVLESRRWS